MTTHSDLNPADRELATEIIDEVRANRAHGHPTPLHLCALLDEWDRTHVEDPCHPSMFPTQSGTSTSMEEAT